MNPMHGSLANLLAIAIAGTALAPHSTTDPSAAAHRPPAKLPFYIGTYTSPGGSKGIYEAWLDLSTGEISVPKLAAESDNPSYLAVSPDATKVYAANENDHGSVTAFAINRDRLRFLNIKSVQGGAPCYVSVNSEGTTLLEASYNGGCVSSIRLRPDGSLGPIASVIHNAGSGPNKDRQDSSHMHWAQADARSHFAYSCDLGTDKVQVYRLDAASGTLTEKPDAVGQPLPGSGPRHGAFHPTKPILYVNDEMAGTVTAFFIQKSNGALSRFQTLTTLPDGKPVPGNTTAEIQVDPAGRFLYVSNRGHNSIAVYKIQIDGTLSLVQIDKLAIQVPRGFSLDPTGQWLVVAGQNSNDLTALKVDPTSGTLSGGTTMVSVSKPVCVVFCWDGRS